jgi:hypothetical protein
MTIKTKFDLKCILKIMKLDSAQYKEIIEWLFTKVNLTLK